MDMAMEHGAWSMEHGASDEGHTRGRHAAAAARSQRCGGRRRGRITPSLWGHMGSHGVTWAHSDVGAAEDDVSLPPLLVVRRVAHRRGEASRAAEDKPWAGSHGVTWSHMGHMGKPVVPQKTNPGQGHMGSHGVTWGHMGSHG
eukprot:2478355-Prymnesium_polylepis.1